MSDAEGHWPSGRSRALDWLVNETRDQPFFDNLFGDLCRVLVEDGVPVDRATVHIRTLHPEFLAGIVLWRPDMEQATLERVPHGIFEMERFKRSPLHPILRGEVSGIRQRFDIPFPEDAPRYQIYDELQAMGIVDYVVMPMRFVSGTLHAVTWATRQSGGFSTPQLQRLNDLMPVLEMTLEIRLNRRIAKNLLNTYVGTRAGERILAGEIERGSGETIRAAIWYCDLRGSTILSEKLPRDQLIDSLNQFFDTMARPVMDHGGEVLKFIGDAMLAIFPLDSPEACKRAFRAARIAMDDMDMLNREREARGQMPMGYGLVLHVGDVMYGNIGSTSRLDFTVIGPAVNVAARLDDLAKWLGCKLLVSAEFAGMCEFTAANLVPIGSFRLSGVERDVEVQGLPDPVAPALAGNVTS